MNKILYISNQKFVGDFLYLKNICLSCCMTLRLCKLFSFEFTQPEKKANKKEFLRRDFTLILSR